MSEANVIAYIVKVDVKNKATKERFLHKVLFVSSDVDAIARSVETLYGGRDKKYKVVNIQAVVKPVHVLSTFIKSDEESTGPYVQRVSGTEKVYQQGSISDDTKCFAVGVATSMIAVNEDHAMRKLARALAIKFGAMPDQRGPELSQDASITIEEISTPSGYSRGRDVSAEYNRAHIVRG